MQSIADGAEPKLPHQEQEDCVGSGAGINVAGAEKWFQQGGASVRPSYSYKFFYGEFLFGIGAHDEHRCARTKSFDFTEQFQAFRPGILMSNRTRSQSCVVVAWA
jgi:hypothetical protein